MLFGNWQSDEALTMETVKSVTIDAHKSLIKVMFDGEVMTLQTPLEFKIRPLALNVLVPPEGAEVLEGVPVA
jgi:diacylglycerol kinase family enzyme